MNLKKGILSKYLEGQDTLHIIGHGYLKYARLILVYWLILFGAFFLYSFILSIIKPFSILNWVFGIGLFISYIKFMISFLDYYLDSLVLTREGVILFYWGGFFKLNSEAMPWGSVRSVSDNQSGLLDIIWNQWYIEIKREKENYTFQVANPAQKANLITNTRNQIKSWEKDNTPQDFDKFDILVETLGEVILDYIQQ